MNALRFQSSSSELAISGKVDFRSRDQSFQNLGGTLELAKGGTHIFLRPEIILGWSERQNYIPRSAHDRLNFGSRVMKRVYTSYTACRESSVRSPKTAEESTSIGRPGNLALTQKKSE